MIFDSMVIGGGFFGCSIAQKLSGFRGSVILLEEGDQLFHRASFSNQARVHGGYHYPRSFLTAKRSRINYAHFLELYSESVVPGFRHYYAVSSSLSQISAKQFTQLCHRIGAPLAPAPPEIRTLFNRETIEDVFEVEESVFDARKLRARLEADLSAAGVTVSLNSSAHSLARESDGSFRVQCRDGREIRTKEIWVCTYSALNRVLAAFGQSIIPMQLEIAEMALVEAPEALRRAGVTVMDGPFFSLMPFPAKALHTFSHVRYTPHLRWKQPENTLDESTFERRSRFESMKRDAARYLPLLSQCTYRDSLWETKALLPQSEENDSRPILFRTNFGLPGLHCVLGGKIDNIFDCLAEVEIYCGADPSDRKAGL